MRDILSTVGALASAFLTAIIFFGGLYVVTWYDHTQGVQEWAQESFDKFDGRDVSWTTVDVRTGDTEQLIELARDSIVATTFVPFIGPFKQEVDDYKNAVFDLVKLLQQTPEERDAIFAAWQKVTMAQIDLKWANEDFQQSTIRAMRYTF